MNLKKELDVALDAAIKSKEIILKYYHSNFDVEIKDDNSPVTNADKDSDKLIREILHNEFPNYAFLTEESVDDKSRLNNDYVWIVDPVDGTKDFINKDDEFTTNIALSYKHEVVLGVVSIPAKNEIYYAIKGEGAYHIDSDGNIKRISVNNKTQDLICLTSVFHTNENDLKIIEKHKGKIKEIQKCGSSIKACRIADGSAEISFRTTNGTKEWDTAAFQIIVEEAGGYVVKPNGERILYNRDDVFNREGYYIVNRLDNIIK